ncbi:MAG: toprim domain-containing protein, partial [Clostridia bacterium]|nr:toprim domain-containing protein [Clostridia bacterium]
GHMDVISLVQGGVKNVVASMGTALTKDQARIIKRYTDNVYISYDGDFAGQKAAIRGLEILKDEGLEVKVVSLPDGKDPDDVIKEQGEAGYRKLLDEAKLLIDFKLDILKRTFDVRTPDGRRKFIKESLRVIAESDSPSETEELLKFVRDETGITYESLRRELEGIKSGTVKEEKPLPESYARGGLIRAEKFILYAFLFNKPYVKDVNINDIQFQSPSEHFIADYIADELKTNGEVRTSLIFDVAPKVFHDAINEVMKLELTEGIKKTEDKFFHDCARCLIKTQTNARINRLTELYKRETDVEQRKAIAKEIQSLTAKK